LNRLVYTHAGPNPPIPPLSQEAEKSKQAGNVRPKLLFQDLVMIL